MESDADECSFCGGEHDRTACEEERCIRCKQAPDNCDCEIADGSNFAMGRDFHDK